MAKDKETYGDYGKDGSPLADWSGNGRSPGGDDDGDPDNSDPSKWTGNGRGTGMQSSDGGPYKSSDTGFSQG